MMVDFTDSINAASVKRFMEQLIKDHPNAKTIDMIMRQRE
jgi:hypothetical protein